MSNELFNWGSENNEDRRQREQRELAFMFERANAINAKASVTGGSGGGGGINSPIFTGIVLDGRISGATVTDVDSGTTVITNANGEFGLNAVPTGKIRAYGGIDTLTGLEYTGQLETPAGETIISPISTLVSKLMDSGETKTDAARLIIEQLPGSYKLPAIDGSFAETLLKINYIDDAVDNNDDNSLTIQSLANNIEISTDLVSNMAIGKLIDGDVSSNKYASRYRTAKDNCFGYLADQLKAKNGINASDMLKFTASIDPEDGEYKTLEVIYRGALQEISDISGDQALNINYQTVSIASANRSTKSYKEDIISMYDPANGVDLKDIDACVTWTGAEGIREDIESNKDKIGNVKKGTPNVIEESYSGYGIKETSAYYLNENEFGDEFLTASGPNIIYAKDFKVGSSIWSSISVLNNEFQKIENYRYKWPTKELNQKHFLLASDNVYLVEPIIGEKDKQFEKEKQAYIAKIGTVSEFLEEIGSNGIKVPQPDKIKLENPANRIPNPVPGEKYSPAPDLNGKELQKNPASAPVNVPPTVPGGERTEEVKYKDAADEIKLVEAIEKVGSEIVKEELIIRDETTGKELVSDVINSNEKLEEVDSAKKNSVSTEKVAVRDITAVKVEYISTKAKADSNYLEE
jgi:hypothetical protein